MGSRYSISALLNQGYLITKADDAADSARLR